MDPLLATSGPCLSSQPLKQKGDITFMVFIWNGGSLKTSSAHPKISVTAVNNMHMYYILDEIPKKRNLLGSGFPVSHCFDAKNL